MSPDEQKDNRPVTPNLGEVLVQKLLQLIPLIQRVAAEAPILGGGFFGFILHSPQLIVTAWALYKFIMEAEGDMGRAKRIQYLQDAITSLRVSKDPTKLTELFNGRTLKSPHS